MNNFSLRTFILPALVILLVGGGLFFYFNSKKLPQAETQNLQIPSGLAEAQKNAQTYSSLVLKTIIQETIGGTIAQINEENLTLEAEGQSMTIPKEANGRIRYAKLPKTASGSAQGVPTLTIDADELKIGDKVQIIRYIDLQTGSTSIVAITVLP